MNGNRSADRRGLGPQGR